MQLVGAKPSYIRRPFLMQSILQGAVSALIGIALLMTLFYALNNMLNSFEISYSLETFLLLVVSLMGIGIIITFISTWFALNKYLRMKLDDLY
jgi:cell division transport system permease protein